VTAAVALNLAHELPWDFAQLSRTRLNANQTHITEQGSRVIGRQADSDLNRLPVARKPYGLIKGERFEVAPAGRPIPPRGVQIVNRVRCIRRYNRRLRLLFDLLAKRDCILDRRGQRSRQIVAAVAKSLPSSSTLRATLSVRWEYSVSCIRRVCALYRSRFHWMLIVTDPSVFRRQRKATRRQLFCAVGRSTRATAGEGK
jgi:hypothetical protein